MGQKKEKNRIPKIPEKRHYPRIEMELPVELEVDGKKVQATTDNISCGGMFLPDIAELLEEQQDVIAFVTLPDQSKSIRLPAKIARIERKIANNSKGIALQFDGLYDTNRLEIDRYVKWKLLN